MVLVSYIWERIAKPTRDVYLLFFLCYNTILILTKRYLQYVTKLIKKFCKTIYSNLKSIPLAKSLFKSQYISLQTN